MRFYVYFGVLLIAAVTSAELYPTIKESSVEASSDLSKIINGNLATEGQFPYMVQIRGRLVCGGALISASWVLSEAFCINGVTVVVHLGTVNISKPVLVIVTHDTRTHPQYNAVTYENNIGLVNLMHTVVFDETISPIALPRQSQAFPDFGVGRTATILGWGNVVENDPPSVESLSYGTAFIASSSFCKSTEEFEIFPTMLCATPVGQPPQNVCFYDWGGLMILHDTIISLDILVGIMNYPSASGCISGRPSIWVRPQFYLNWINNHTDIPIRP